MKVLTGVFVRYILIPLLVVIFVVILNSLTKMTSKLNMKRVIIFILLTSIILALPSLLGLLKYEFVWGGLIFTVFLYLLLGILIQVFFRTKLFKSMGFDGKKGYIFFMVFIILILSMWIYFLVFERLSGLPYAFVAMLNVFWFVVPLFYAVSRELFLSIPPPFYTSWKVGNNIDYEYWEKLDTFKLIQVTVKIKRKPTSENYSSFSVKLPEEVSLGEWFDKLIEDQNIRTPKDAIEIIHNELPVDWIFYTDRWFRVPLFTRVLDPNADNAVNKIKNKQVIYIRRTVVNDDDE